VPELEANALSMIGMSRGLSGDLAGREDLERSIAIAESIGSQLSVHCCGVLADLECQVGDLAACFALQARARGHAERFGNAGLVRWLATERIGEAYWAGDWDQSLDLGERAIEESEAGIPNFMIGQCHVWRGQIRLARGDNGGARDDADRALELGRASDELQMLYPVLAFAARAQVTVGSPDAADALTKELLALWRKNIGAYPASAWSVDLAWALDGLGRSVELVETAREAPAMTRWLEAVVAFASGQADEAAARFGQIGSRPDQAFALLRAAQDLCRAGRAQESATHLGPAMAFFRRVGATTYLREAERLAQMAHVSRVQPTTT
jgi:hypothetical protein